MPWVTDSRDSLFRFNITGDFDKTYYEHLNWVGKFSNKYPYNYAYRYFI